MFSLLSISRTLFRPANIFTRNRGELAPRQVKYLKRHKGVIPIPIGGSIKGTTLAFGQWGLRIKGNGVRFSAKQLTTAEDVIKRKLKVLKGAKVYLRVFPDIPVCIKVGRIIHNRELGLYFLLGKRNPYGQRQGNL